MDWEIRSGGFKDVNQPVNRQSTRVAKLFRLNFDLVDHQTRIQKINANGCFARCPGVKSAGAPAISPQYICTPGFRFGQ